MITKDAMQQAFYTYTFDCITDESSRVRMVDCQRSLSAELQVKLNDRQFLSQTLQQMPSLLADLVDVAIAVHVADRFSLHVNDLPRQIHIELPIRHTTLFSQSHIIDRLQTILYWYTGDHWDFSFRKRLAPGRWAEMQQSLPFEKHSSQATEVALWSGGLDSLAGLLHRQQTNSSEQYMLLGAGSNTIIQHAQNQVFKGVRDLAQKHRQFTDALHLVQVPFSVTTPAPLLRSSAQLTRGFVFALLGAVCACLNNQRVLQVYENGIGAINLPFRASEVGTDHTRAVHPLSLHEVSLLLTNILGQPFRVVNPFLFHTKAEMCEALIWANATHLIADTISCDSLHRVHPMQCGFCSSCLLRGQALAASHIPDPTTYVLDSFERRGKTHQIRHSFHYRAMIWQLQKLQSILDAPSPWEHLAQAYPRLIDTVDITADFEGVPPNQIQRQLLAMYER